MFKYITLLTLSSFLVTPFLFAENTMKCEAGKCSTGNSGNEKKIPTKKEPIPAKDTPLKESNKRHTKQNRPTIEQLFNVRTVQVSELNSAKSQENYGYIVAQDSSIVDVLTWYSGFVVNLYADTLFKKVKKGEPLVKVYSPEVYKAKQDYLNSLNYHAKMSMPEMLKSAEIKLKLLGVSEKEIQAIKKERHTDAYTTVYAPISGWVFEKNVNEGASFTSKKRLFQIVNLDKVWMEAKLFQDELPNVAKLKNFEVNVKGIETKFNAEKLLLYPMLDTKEATATLRLSIDNPSGILKPGMYAKVHAKADNKRRIVIPRTAAIRKNGTWYAFLATDFQGEYEPMAIDLRPLDNKHYEVLSGLKLGDNVVNNALFMMDSDAQINSIY
jgi:Cu(I)/Ag(I) efflux system membrane fusion protein